jgi:intraflagellar transport protein 140
MGVLTGWRCDQNGQFLTMFNHNLKDPLLHVTFRKTVQNATTTELSNLARMAVAGDESALDTLTSWRPRTAARNLSHAGVKDNHCFYVGTQSGILYYINQTGTCTEVLRNDSAPVVQVLWHPKRETIITLMEDMTVGHYLVESTGNLTELDRVKLSARATGQSGAMSWAGNALAIITGDLSVRIWDIDTSDSYVLSMELPTTTDSQKPNSLMSARRAAELFTCLAFCTDNQTLCSGTNQGNLFIWRKTNFVAPSSDTLTANPEDMWQLTNICTVRGAIKPDGVRWGVTETMKPCILINCISNVFILKVSGCKLGGQ